MIRIENGSSIERQEGENGRGRLLFGHEWNGTEIAVHVQNMPGSSPDARVLSKTGYPWAPIKCENVVAIPDAKDGINSRVTLVHEKLGTNSFGHKGHYRQTVELKETAAEILTALEKSGLPHMPKVRAYNRVDAFRDKLKQESPYLSYCP